MAKRQVLVVLLSSDGQEMLLITEGPGRIIRRQRVTELTRVKDTRG